MKLRTKLAFGFLALVIGTILVAIFSSSWQAGLTFVGIFAICVLFMLSLTETAMYFADRSNKDKE